MNISGISFDPYSKGVGAYQKALGSQGAIPGTNKENDRDSYIPSMSALAADMAIPTSNYNAQGLMEEGPSMGGVDIVDASGASGSYMDVLSEAFRANEDNIQAALDNMGLSIEDLADMDNMTAFADAMEKGAVNMGLPPVDDKNGVIERASSSIKAAVEAEDFGGATKSPEPDNKVMLYSSNFK